MNKVFVYGTLKQGFWNHSLLDGSKFLGQGITKEKYALYVQNIPYVVKDEPVSRIHGEIYEINEDVLERLDKLEGHPEWYRREIVSIDMNNSEEKTKSIDTWLYFYPFPSGLLVLDGIFKIEG